MILARGNRLRLHKCFIKFELVLKSREYLGRTRWFRGRATA